MLSTQAQTLLLHYDDLPAQEMAMLGWNKQGWLLENKSQWPKAYEKLLKQKSQPEAWQWSYRLQDIELQGANELLRFNAASQQLTLAQPTAEQLIAASPENKEMLLPTHIQSAVIANRSNGQALYKGRQQSHSVCQLQQIAFQGAVICLNAPLPDDCNSLLLLLETDQLLYIPCQLRAAKAISKIPSLPFAYAVNFKALFPDFRQLLEQAIIEHSQRQKQAKLSQ